MADNKSIRIVVLVDEAHRDKMSEVVQNLQQKGFVLTESLDAIGVLTGTIATAELQELPAVPGVSAVEHERTDYRPQQ